MNVHYLFLNHLSLTNQYTQIWLTLHYPLNHRQLKLNLNRITQSTLLSNSYKSGSNLPGTIQAGHAANKMFSKKNGAQHSTNVKNTRPRTLVAFCSFATAFAERDLPFLRLARNLEQNKGY